MTQRYIDITRQGKNDWWRYLVGFVIPPLFILVSGIFGGIILAIYSGLFLQTSTEKLLKALPFTATYSFAMVGIVGFVLGMRFVIERIHQRPFLSLISADDTLQMQRLISAMGLWLLMRCGSGAFMYTQHPQDWQLAFNFTQWLTFLPLTGLFCTIFSSVGMLYFIAYPLQGISAVIRKSLPLKLFISALLTVLINLVPRSVKTVSTPLAFGVDKILDFIYFFILFKIILRDNRLELLLGMVAADGFYSTAIVRVLGERKNPFWESFPTIWEMKPIDNLFDSNPLLYVATAGLFFGRLAIFYYVFLGKRDRA